MPRIVLRLVGRATRSFTLNAEPVSIGRAGDNDIIVDNERVSRHHARIVPAHSAYVLHDIGSTNGVRVNGELITGPRTLAHGDRIHLSGVDVGVELVFDADIQTIRDRGPAPVADGSVRVDLDAAEVWIAGRRVALTQREYRALALLHGRTPALVTKEDLAAHVWQEDGGVVSDASIEQLIHRLRGKLKAPAEQPSPLQIVTIRGLGYRLVTG